MRALNKKLLRDLMRLWAQALAIALVMAAGAATLILAAGAYRSLEETRSAYYERYRFADVFATLKRAPSLVERRILEIPGVAAAETRISEFALLDIEGMVQPATGMAISLPDHHPQRLNRLYIRSGRLPQPGRVDEVTVNEAFANAHGFTIGSTFKAILNGNKRTLRIVGVALSPEFIYALGPGDLIPDDRRFAVMWMSEKALAAIFDLEGAFNSVSLKLLRSTSEAEVIKQLDDILDRYGGTGAYGREDHQSHAFIDAELKQLRAMGRVLPPIFLAVSAFLLNMTLMRLIALEREQIGLLKALGYPRMTIALHYLKLVLCIAGVGVVIGGLAGTWLGQGLTYLYVEFFHFPFLIFLRDPDIYLIAGGVSALTALIGGLRGVHAALILPPAVAMSPPAPTRYAMLGIERLTALKIYSQLTMMALRHMLRWPVRTGLTILGIAMSGALLITALFTIDSVDEMIETIFFRAERQDATLNFTDERPISVVQGVKHLPGVMKSEPFRSVAVRLRNGPRHRKLAIQGKPLDTDLSRVLDLDLNPITMPETGLALSERVAKLLDVRRGDIIEVEILEGKKGQARIAEADVSRIRSHEGEPPAYRNEKRGVRYLPVTEIFQSFLGLTVYMNLAALNEMMDESPVVSGVNFAFDKAQTGKLYTKVKELPAVASIALRGAALAKFRETIAKNIYIMTVVYVVLSVIIAFGVIYNSARIQLSERAREFASLRVLGFTRAEVSGVLLVELAILVGVAIPFSWGIGYLFAWATIQGFENDLYRVPFTIESDTYAIASVVVLAAASVSALIVRRHIDRLDMIRALKTRE
jgi:putative ABC transport system permease protein